MSEKLIVTPEEATAARLRANNSRKIKAVEYNNTIMIDAQMIHRQLVDCGREHALRVLKLASAMYYPEYLDVK